MLRWLVSEDPRLSARWAIPAAAVALGALALILVTKLSYLVVGLYAAAAVLVVVGLPSLRGQPEKHAGHFFLDDHGNLKEVSRAAYDRAVIAQDRLFLGASALFVGIGAVINLRLAPVLSAASCRDEAE